MSRESREFDPPAPLPTVTCPCGQKARYIDDHDDEISYDCPACGLDIWTDGSGTIIHTERNEP